MLLKAAINGGRTRAEHSAVPISPEEQAAAVNECLQAGAQAIHLHIRAESGAESLLAEDVARTLSAVKSAAPDAPIGVSTGLWILPDVAARLRAVTAWQGLPDFASVNFVEEGAVELAQLLLSRGIAVEAGLSDAGAVENFLESGLVADCFRILLEPQEQTMADALGTVNAMESLLDRATDNPPRVLHGTEATTWPMLDQAVRRGYGARIGLEDTLILPDGQRANSNAQLVAAAVKAFR